MRKILIFLVVLVFLSCGGEKTQEGVATIIFKHGKVAGQSGYLTKLIEKFEAQNLDVKVKEEILPSITDQQHQFYVTSLGAGSGDFDVWQDNFGATLPSAAAAIPEPTAVALLATLSVPALLGRRRS